MESCGILPDAQVLGEVKSKNDSSTELLLFTWISSGLRQLQNYLTTKEYKIIEGLFIHQYDNHLTEAELEAIKTITSLTNLTSLQTEEVKKGVNALFKRRLLHEGHLELINYFLEGPGQIYYQFPQEYFQFKENLLNQLYSIHANTQTENHSEKFLDFQILVKTEDEQLAIELNARIYNSSEDRAKDEANAANIIQIYDKSPASGILTNQDIRTLEFLLNEIIHIKDFSLVRIISSVKSYLNAVKEGGSKKRKGLGSKGNEIDSIEIPHLPRLYNLNKIQLFAPEVTADVRLIHQELKKFIKRELPRAYSVYFIQNILQPDKINNFIEQIKQVEDI